MSQSGLTLVTRTYPGELDVGLSAPSCLTPRTVATHLGKRLRTEFFIVLNLCHTKHNHVEKHVWWSSETLRNLKVTRPQGTSQSTFYGHTTGCFIQAPFSRQLGARKQGWEPIPGFDIGSTSKRINEMTGTGNWGRDRYISLSQRIERCFRSYRIFSAAQFIEPLGYGNFEDESSDGLWREIVDVVGPKLQHVSSRFPSCANGTGRIGEGATKFMR